MKLLEDSSPAGFTVQKLSIERIAREAGVSKTTIYGWWSSKVAVVIDTFLDNHVARTPVREDVPAIDALREYMASLADVYAGNEGRLIAQLIGECQQDEATMAEFKKLFWTPRSRATTLLVARAIDEGSMHKDLDAQVVTEMLYAPIYFRLLFQAGPLDAKATDAIMQRVLERLSVGK